MICFTGVYLKNYLLFTNYYFICLLNIKNISFNLIFYNNLVYISEVLRLEILTKYHEKPAACHLGIRKTLELITKTFVA